MIIKDLVFGFGHWTLSDRFFLLWFQKALKLKITFVDEIRAILCKINWSIKNAFFHEGCKRIAKYFDKKKKNVCQRPRLFGHPLYNAYNLNFESNGQYLERLTNSVMFSLNRPHWADSVRESPCPSVFGSVCVRHWVHIFRPFIGSEVT